MSKTLKKQRKNITESLIKAIHKELVKGRSWRKRQTGECTERHKNYVGNVITGEIIYMPPKPREVPRPYERFCPMDPSKNQTSIPVLKSGIIQFQFVHIHPFVDGNGRASRLLCAAYLYKEGL